jgi:hypothetical protein
MESTENKEQFFLWKLTQIQIVFRMKIQGSFYGLNFNENSPKKLGTLEFDEI